MHAGELASTQGRGEVCHKSKLGGKLYFVDLLMAVEYSTLIIIT